MVPALSILVCTYNRSALLALTLSAIARLKVPPGWTAELVLVDNNSTDDTQAVIGRHRQSFPFPIVGLVERRQGKSFALNSGLRALSGSIVALTDDDVVPQPDWLERVVAAFEERDISFVFGKVLPNWELEPPPYLLTAASREIWGPMALLDYDDEPLDYTAETFSELRYPVGANLAFTRDALVRIGGWRTDLGKVDNSLIAGEDYEIFHRLLRAGLFAGRYDPSVVVHHHVPAARVEPSYFRRWFYWNGRTIARILPDYYPEVDFDSTPRIGGVPRFLYRQAIEQWLRWAFGSRRTRQPDRWVRQLHAIRYTGLLMECWRQRFAGQHATAAPAMVGPTVSGELGSQDKVSG